MPQIYLTRGCALANLGKYKEGVIELKKSLQLDPENEVAQKCLERVLIKYEEEQKLLYTKQAKQLSFDKQRLEMKNNAALNFNAQENTYKFVGEGDYETQQRVSEQKQQNLLNQSFQQKEQNQIQQNKNISTISSTSEINSKRTFTQLSKKEDKSNNNLRSSSSSSSDRKKKKKKDKKSKKDKKDKKDKKKRSKS